MRQTIPLRVTGNLINLGSKCFRIFFFSRISVQPFQKFFHTGQLQRRTKIAGKDFPLSDKSADFFPCHRTCLQIFFQQRLIADCEFFGKLLLSHAAEIQAAVVQLFLQFLHQPFPVSPLLIHLINKEEHRNPVTLQQPPQRQNVSLYAVRAADDQDSIIENLQSSLHLRGKIHMSGCVQQRHLFVLQRKTRLLGKNRDSSRPLHLIRIQKGVSVIHPPHFPNASGQIQNTLRQRRLAGVYVSEHSYR